MRPSTTPTVLSGLSIDLATDSFFSACADEILFQSHVHPLQLASSLSPEQITLLRNKMIDICTTAVAVRADSSKFPNDWLFGVRWGKGKGKGKDAAVTLADGSLGRVEFITVSLR